MELSLGNNNLVSQSSARKLKVKQNRLSTPFFCHRPSFLQNSAFYPNSVSCQYVLIRLYQNPLIRQPPPRCPLQSLTDQAMCVTVYPVFMNLRVVSTYSPLTAIDPLPFRMPFSNPWIQSPPSIDVRHASDPSWNLPPRR